MFQVSERVKIFHKSLKTILCLDSRGHTSLGSRKTTRKTRKVELPSLSCSKSGVYTCFTPRRLGVDAFNNAVCRARLLLFRIPHYLYPRLLFLRPLPWTFFLAWRRWDMYIKARWPLNYLHYGDHTRSFPRPLNVLKIYYAYGIEKIIISKPFSKFALYLNT